MNEQLTLFDWMPTLQQEPDIGTYVDRHGAVIPHIMRSAYIGSKVVIDVSTSSHKWFLVGTLENYFECRGVMRSVVFTGERQRHLVDHYEGVNIYECLPWDAYPKRMDAIYGHAQNRR